MPPCEHEPSDPSDPRWRAAAVAALVLPLLTTVGGDGAAAATCDPFTTPATYDRSVPTAKSVLGFDLGQREVTTAESDRYLTAIDQASGVVRGDVLATSNQGRPLRYAVVGAPARVAAAQSAARQLRDPATTPSQAAALAASAPAILWVAANVHGGEESGTDASLRVLYELAARTDCAAAQIRDNAVVAILPTQNPDGRELDTRRNAYGFDMNRDWFARTQPETDGKLEALRQYPPVLFIDSHEMGSKDYFFPPNADPIYHETTDESVSWINGLYGPAMQQEFGRQKIPYFNYAVYDLFYQGYGDTVPTTAFGGAGMTFEKSGYDGIGKRLYEQYVAIWTSLSAAATHKADILTGLASSYREAQQQGADGVLEPNEVVQPENTVQNEVPDIRVRHYFLRADDPSKAARGPGAGPPAAADGRRRPAAHRTADRAGLHAVLRVGVVDDPAGRHLLDPDGAGAEALGAGDAQREHLHAVPVLLRRDRVEPAAAVQRCRRPVRRRALARLGSRAAGGRTGRGAAAGRCPDRHGVADV